MNRVFVAGFVLVFAFASLSILFELAVNPPSLSSRHVAIESDVIQLAPVTIVGSVHHNEEALAK